MEGFFVSYVDLAVFIVSFGVSLLIGIYYGFVSKKQQNSPVEYLLGGKKMGILPVAASLVATQLSGPSLLGMPAEIYAFGTQYWLIIFPTILMTIAVIKIHLRVIYEQGSLSSFIYIQRRFGWRVKKMMSAIYALSTLLFLPVAIYVPALTLNQMTGLDIYASAMVLSVLCLFYTLFGGMRAILWTDTLQLALMLTATILVALLAVHTAGGVQKVWEAADRGGRLIFFNFNIDMRDCTPIQSIVQFLLIVCAIDLRRLSCKSTHVLSDSCSMNASPVVRVSFWTIAVGNPFTLLFHLGLNPTSIQRYITVPSFEAARTSVIAMSVGYVVFQALFLITGLALYANYEACDPVTEGVIRKIDQIVPHFIVEKSDHIPGLAGLFAAGIFSASLSSMSSCLNTLSGCIYEDFLATTFRHFTESQKSLLLKGIVLVMGVIQLALVFLVDSLGTMVFLLTVSVVSISGGIVIGIFTAGMLLPKMNSCGALCGGISALVAVGSITIGAQMRLKEPTLPLRSDGCSNSTLISAPIETPDQEDVSWIFRINYMFYALLGFALVFIIGYPVSLMTGGERVKDERLLTPCLRKRKPERQDIQYNAVNAQNNK
ncbi:sodium-coupled monocarboxylate transporter 1-like [Phlebotomus argentipes]|uniref:sodium-coupled monocarboxylate transporter 1-like n=1 Tax=Phlebotomus argentipes TaxID=94469 RepID=UPI002892A1B1|nr:sodium-coupled monocarboxylate transporter 1-like [Phlebotomus argentipes]